MRKIKLSFLLPAGFWCFIGCGEIQCDGFIGKTCIVKTDQNVNVWDNLPEFIYESAQAIEEECGEQDSIGVKIFIYPREFLPQTEENETWAEGRFKGTKDEPEIHVRENEDIFDSSLSHEIFSHYVPFVCKEWPEGTPEETRTNLKHAPEWVQYMREKTWQVKWNMGETK